MPKLNQIVAVVNGKKTEAQKALTEVYRKCGKPELFNGLHRTYRPLDEEGETFPDEIKPVEYTVDEALKESKEILSNLFDIIATQDYNNGTAVADVIVDSETVLEKVPVTYLLFLEKQLTDLNTFVSKLPTLDVGESWNKDLNKDLYVSGKYDTHKTKKVLQHKVLYEATTSHPAQVEKWTEDARVGTWVNQKFSGAMPVTEKKALLEKLKKLQDAVKFARETANSLEVKMVTVGDKVFNYLTK
jgi:hypothetical protein